MPFASPSATKQLMVTSLPVNGGPCTSMLEPKGMPPSRRSSSLRSPVLTLSILSSIFLSSSLASISSSIKPFSLILRSSAFERRYSSFVRISSSLRLICICSSSSFFFISCDSMLPDSRMASSTLRLSSMSNCSLYTRSSSRLSISSSL